MHRLKHHFASLPLIAKYTLVAIVFSLILVATGCPQPFTPPNDLFQFESASANNHTIVLMDSGYAYAFGPNDQGQLGRGFSSTDAEYIPSIVMKDNRTALADIAAVAAGGGHSLFLLDNGEVWAVGENSAGQLGDGSTTDRLYPVRVKTGSGTYLENVQAIAAGNSHSVFLCDNGTVWTSGDNGYGQLGTQDLVQRTYATQIFDAGTVPIDNAFAIAARAQFTLVAIDVADPDPNMSEAVVFGDNNQGQLGQGSTNGAEPVPVAMLVAASVHLLNVASLSAGDSHSLIGLTNGSVVASGDNYQCPQLKEKS